MFEPTEKRLEIHWRESSPRFRHRTMVERFLAESKATVVSVTGAAEMDAYILAESSLLAWDHKLILITCGRTPLVRAAEWILQAHAADIAFLSFSRQKDVFPEEQTTLFAQDAERLAKLAEEAQVVTVTNKGTAHDYLFVSSVNLESIGRQTTRFAFHFDGPLPVQNVDQAARLRKLFGIDKFFKNYEVDDHLFSPWGYSLNALKDRHYLTLHVSQVGSRYYVTVETDDPILCPPEIMAYWTALFQPAEGIAIIKHDSSGRPQSALQKITAA